MTSPNDHTRVFIDGRVWTGSGEAEAIATRGDRVLGHGPSSDMVDLAGSGAERVELDGRRVVPGLIDSHVHILRAGQTWLDVVRWDEGVSSLGDALGRISSAAETAGPGVWLRVLGGWHPGQFLEGRGPTREELDLAAPSNPVYCQLLYEDALLNQQAIEAVLVGRDDPPGGSIERDEHGAPTGRIRGPGAFAMVLGSIPPPTRDRARESTAALMRDFNAAGLTGAVDPGGFGVVPETYGPLFDLWRAGEMTVRTGLYLVPATRGDEVSDVREWVRYVQPMFGDDMLRYLGLGEILTFGCHDLEGLTDFAVSRSAKEDLGAIVRLLSDAGWNVHMHSVLDGTTSDVLDVWEEVAAERGLNGRYSLGHIEPISLRNVGRMAALGVGAGIQNRMMFRAADSAAVWGGDDVIVNAPPLRDLIDAGIPVGGGTDGTVVSPFDPWRSIWWLVTGRSVDGAPPRAERHRMSVAEALGAYTSGSAWIAIADDRRGRLEPGMLADLAVLDRDPFEIDADDLPDVRSDLTMVGDRIVHTSAAFTGLATGDS